MLGFAGLPGVIAFDLATFAVAALALGSVVSRALEAPVWVAVLLGFAFAYAVLELIFTLWYRRRM